MFRRLQLLLAMGLLALGCNAKKTRDVTANGEKVLARIDGEPITNADLVAALAAYSHDPYIQARYTSPEKRKDLLQNLIVFKVMLAEAKRQGLENDPEVRRARMEALAKAYIEKEINSRIKASDISQETIAAYYGAHRTEFTRPDEVRINQIIVAEEAKALRLAQQARALPRLDRARFGAMVAANSEDEDSKDRGGDSLFFDRQTKRIDPALREAAFALKAVGEVAGPIAAQRGFAIIRLADRRPAHTRPLSECADEIRGRLLEKARVERLDAIVAEARQHTHIEIYDDVLAKIPPPTGSAPDAARLYEPFPTLERGPTPGSP